MVSFCAGLAGLLIWSILATQIANTHAATIHLQDSTINNMNDTIAKSSSILEKVKQSGAGFVDVEALNSAISGHATLSVYNQYLLTKVEIDTRTNRIGVSSIPTTFSLPIGQPITIGVSSVVKDYWLQPFSAKIERDDNVIFEEYVVGQIVVVLRRGDRVTLRMQRPSVPWNATTINFRGETALFTVESPRPGRSLHRIPQLKEGELPNAALYWARDGKEDLAASLARHFIKTRARGSRTIKYQVKDTSLLMPLSDNGFDSSFLEISEEELTEKIESALSHLEQSRDQHGILMRQYFELARDELPNFLE